MMHTSDTIPAIGGQATNRSLARRSLSRRFLERLVRQVAHGQLLIRTPSGEAIHHVGSQPGPSGVWILHRWRAARRLLFGGDVGFGESYMAGDWSTPDLAALIEMAARNRPTMMLSWDGLHLTRLFHRVRHLLRGNSKRGSQRNIPAHYDLGNDFYAAWLDADMTYSAGFYTAANTGLEDAQAAKQDLVMKALALSGDERVLEIGCGWGALAGRLAREHGCHVTGLTLSPAQLAFAQAKLKDRSRPGSVDLRLQDYRDVTGQFDRIVSIEMLEAVGREYWDAYFSAVRDRLRSGGIALLQVITMAADRYDDYADRADFIQRHIFPGGMLPSDGVMRAKIAQHGLHLEHATNFGASYARTLADWNVRFQRAWPKLAAMGFDDVFKRKWEYYLGYSEGGFRAGAIDVGLYCVRKP